MGIIELKEMLWKVRNREENKVVTITHRNLYIQKDAKLLGEDDVVDFDDDEWDDEYIDEDDIYDEEELEIVDAEEWSDDDDEIDNPEIEPLMKK